MTQMPIRNRTEEWMNKQQYNQAYNEIRYRDETEQTAATCNEIEESRKRMLVRVQTEEMNT